MSQSPRVPPGEFVNPREKKVDEFVKQTMEAVNGARQTTKLRIRGHGCIATENREGGDRVYNNRRSRGVATMDNVSAFARCAAIAWTFFALPHFFGGVCLGRTDEPPLSRPIASRESSVAIARSGRVNDGDSKRPPIPEVEAIESIVAEAYSHPLPIADVKPFNIPKKDWHNLLAYLRQAERDDSRWPPQEEIGSARIVLVGGRSVRICWFWHGQGGRLSFTCDGLRYTTVGERFAKDETLTLDASVRKVYNREVLHTDERSAPFSFSKTNEEMSQTSETSRPRRVNTEPQCRGRQRGHVVPHTQE
jgi:hypothetical protein